MATLERYRRFFRAKAGKNAQSDLTIAGGGYHPAILKK